MNNSYVITPSSNDLQHHGILGQKWGRKNGPPYPLGASDHSASEKKAGWRKSISGKKPNIIQKARQHIFSRQYEEDTNKYKNNLLNEISAKRDKTAYTEKANKIKDIGERREVLSVNKDFDETIKRAQKENEDLIKKYGKMKLDTTEYDKTLDDLNSRLDKAITKTIVDEYKFEEKMFNDYVRVMKKDISDFKKNVPKDVQNYIDNNKGYDLEAKKLEYERYLKDPEKWKQNPDRYKHT